MSGFNMPPGVSPSDIPGNGPDDMDEFERHGYGAVDTGDGLELQKADAIGHFKSDFDACEQCMDDAINGDVYALDCIVKLTKDYQDRNGKGRGGTLHDMDFFDLWGII